MIFVWIAIASCLIALMTFFSGFGLGTLLMPVFAIFFPLPVAIAATAIVHLANNIFKALLIGRQAHLPTLLYFGIPAALAAFIGASLLTVLSTLPKLSFSLLNYPIETTPLNLVIGLLILSFAILELTPWFKHWAFPANYLAIGGGLLSGFLGGLSGHQGAFRSAFLIRSGLSKEAFVATAILSSVLVDLSRLFVYSFSLFSEPSLSVQANLIITAILAAFLGSFLGSKLLQKTSFNVVHTLTGLLLVITGLGLALGLI